MNKNLSIIKNSVLAMGGTIEEFVPERGCFYINIFGRRILLEKKISITRQSFVSGQLTKCKDITHQLLLAHDLPSPQTEAFYKKSFDKDEAIARLSKMTYPIILKDSSGSNSVGIFPFVNNAGEAVKILQKKLPKYRSMIAQKMVFGKEYRILVLGDKVIGALEMIPPNITGDGVSTVKELIHFKQITTDRRTKFDKKFIAILKDQMVTLRTVVPENEVVYIKKSSCLAEGGEMRDVTDEVNEDVRKVCVLASKAVGKYLVGIDVICRDIKTKPTKNNFNILEVNGKPDLYIHYRPDQGKVRDVVKPIVKFMVKEGVLLPKRS